jgi:signal recognition particle subunit SRP54
MTPAERTNPSVLNASRRKRIASGSGRSVEEVNKLIKQFEDMSKVMRMMQGEGGRRQMMNALKGFKG